MTNALVAIADGSEEIEALTIIDVLRRAKINVCVASVMPETKRITAAHGVKIEADVFIAECRGKNWDVIALPGGMPGAEHLRSSAELISLIKGQLAAGKWLAAICASPAVALGRNDLIQAYTATCYPSFQEELKTQVTSLENSRVVVDRNLVTSQGPATAMDFALKLVELLVGEETSHAVAKGMLV